MIELVAPAVALFSALLGFLFGRRKQSAEVESLSVAAAKVAVDSLLLTVEPLRTEIAELKIQVATLERQNSELLAENRRLSRNVSDLRGYLQKLDLWPGYDTEFLKDPTVRGE